MPERFDVAILGGGLAGLTLALQLKRSRPETSIVVAEKREGRAPEAAFKVGESSVELAAYYFGKVCGLEDHIDSEQLEKNGLRFFFPAGDNSDITKRVEWGSTKWLDVPSYQLDRGRFENELADRCRAAGVELLMGSFVDDVDLAPDGHAATVVRGGPGGERTRLEARWLVDATGRSFLLKRKLGLAKDVEHTINAAWFRLANGLDIEEWGAHHEAWMARMAEPGLRKFSTNHLMGEGYWVWLIPLASGSISIGIVADPRFHPFAEFNTLETAMDWLGRHEPQLASALAARAADVKDFLKIEDFAHSCCKRVFSAERWCVTGEAGVFLDPFYSPGSDFIAISNTFIGDLIERDLAGEPIAERTEAYNKLFLSTYDLIIQTVYTDQYAGFGNVQVMQAKLVWDYLLYWSMNVLRYFHGKTCDLEFTQEVAPAIQRAAMLSFATAQLFRDWNAVDQRPWQEAFVEARKFPAVWDRHVQLEAGYDDAALKQRIFDNTKLIEAVAVVLFHKAAEGAGLEVDAEREINPGAISLHPERWEQDGLFEGPGLTLAAARELLPGFEHMWLDELAEQDAAQPAPA